MFIGRSQEDGIGPVLIDSPTHSAASITQRAVEDGSRDAFRPIHAKPTLFGVPSGQVEGVSVPVDNVAFLSAQPRTNPDVPPPIQLNAFGSIRVPHAVNVGLHFEERPNAFNLLREPRFAHPVGRPKHKLAAAQELQGCKTTKQVSEVAAYD